MPSPRYRVAHSAFLGLLLAALAGCGDAPRFDASKFETDGSEAIIRYLHANTPEFRGDKHIYCIVFGSIPRGANPTFVKRFDDLGEKFVQSDRLAVRHQDQVPYDPKTELSPIFLQVTTQTDSLVDKGKIEAAWAYKRKFQKLSLTVEPKPDGTWSVTDSTVVEESLDGSWRPDWQK